MRKSLENRKHISDIFFEPADWYSLNLEERPVRFHSVDIYARQLEQPEQFFMDPSRTNPDFVPLSVEKLENIRGGTEEGKEKDDTTELKLLKVIGEWYSFRALDIEEKAGQ